MVDTFFAFGPFLSLSGFLALTLSSPFLFIRDCHLRTAHSAHKAWATLELNLSSSCQKQQERCRGVGGVWGTATGEGPGDACDVTQC